MRKDVVGAQCQTEIITSVGGCVCELLTSNDVDIETEIEFCFINMSRLVFNRRRLRLLVV